MSSEILQKSVANKTPSRHDGRMSPASTDEEGQYDTPENYTNLNELGAPAPVQNANSSPVQVSRSLEDKVSSHQRLAQNNGASTAERARNPRQPSTSHRVSSSAKNIRLNSRSGSQEEYNAPADFAYLTELQPELPVENPAEERQYSHDDLEHELAQLGSTEDPSTRGKNGQPSVEKGRDSKFLTIIITISHLVFFSILGTLARLGLTSLTAYTGAPVTFPDLWPNLGGSFLLGFLAEGAEIFRHPPAKMSIARSFDDGIAPDPASPSSTEVEDDVAAEDTQGSMQNNNSPPAQSQPRAAPVPLHIGLATGFCGSFTTFAGFIRECFEALSNGASIPAYHPGELNSDPAARVPGQDFMAVAAVIIVTISLSVAALKAGAHLAIFVRRLEKSLSWKVIYWLDRMMIPLAFGTWVGASWAGERWRGQALFALTFAPAGCLLRFFVSIKLNLKVASFPLGTFLVNMSGTMIMAMVWDLQRAPASGSFRGIFNNLVACQVLQGISDGFCGCLTTVSTWVVELSGLRRKHAYFYGFASVAVGLSIAVVIMGPLRWTVGIRQPICTAL